MAYVQTVATYRKGKSFGDLFKSRQYFPIRILHHTVMHIVYMGVPLHTIYICAGVGASICMETSMTCCPLEVEKAMESAAFENTKNMMPPYALFLNESDRVFFPHYGRSGV